MDKLEFIAAINAHLGVIRPSVIDESIEETKLRIAKLQAELKFCQEKLGKQTVLEVDGARDERGRLITPEKIKKDLKDQERRAKAPKGERSKLSKKDKAIKRMMDLLSCSKEEAEQRVSDMGIK